MNGPALSRIVLGALVALALAAFLASLTAYQLTSAGTGQRVLRRAIETTTGLQHALPQMDADVHKLAGQSPGDTVTVPFPITVQLPKDQARSITADALYTRVLDGSAERLYDRGTSGWSPNDNEAQQDIRLASAPGLFKVTLGLITHRWHLVFLGLSVVLGLVSLALAVGLLAALRWTARLFALGLAVLAGGLAWLAVAGLGRLSLEGTGTSDPFVRALLDLGLDAVSVAVRNALAITVVGAVVAVAGAAVLLTGERELARGSAPADNRS